MIVTETEAAERWCPFARVLLPVNQAGNRISTFHLTLTDPRDREYYAQQARDCNCIGSRCMAWREWAESRESPKRGFCGLADT